MSQVLASTRMPVPNVIGEWMGDHGTLYIHTGTKWHVWTGLEWQADKKGYTTQELWRVFKVRPPTNVQDGWAGIAHGGPHPQNWTKRDLRQAFDEFMRVHADEYAKPDGNCWDPLRKGRMLKRLEVEKAGLATMTPAPLLTREHRVRVRV